MFHCLICLYGWRLVTPRGETSSLDEVLLVLHGPAGGGNSRQDMEASNVLEGKNMPPLAPRINGAARRSHTIDGQPNCIGKEGPVGGGFPLTARHSTYM